ncbi:hypothetical protein VL04_03510 [Chromobacterium violaceum]|nr:hypothetical protein VK93_11985 [Chromobacterium violaceum]KMN85187.1 hypothetical protein VL02_16350 [Chromobacterium violaceum]KMN91757.1 hypothetical protein VL04_03510 [Chromobacterium violaceum]KMO02883.1 hypothetical protein VL16_15795 [Chromobacterium violaceum]
MRGVQTQQGTRQAAGGTNKGRREINDKTSIHCDVSKRLCPTKHCERKDACGMQCKGVLNNHGFRAWVTANGGVLSTM